MTDEWGRTNPQMPDPHQHYPRNYSPAGMVDEIAAWHEEHQRWLKEQGVATVTEARRLLSELEAVVSRLDDADAKSVMNDVSTFETDWWGSNR